MAFLIVVPKLNQIYGQAGVTLPSAYGFVFALIPWRSRFGSLIAA